MEDTAAVVTRNSIDPARVVEAIAQSDSAQALNVFDSGPGTSADVLRSLIADPVLRDYASREAQAGALLRGRLLELPAGALSTLIGTHWREQQISVNSLIHASAGRRIASGFADVRIPPGADIPLGFEYPNIGTADSVIAASSGLT